MQAEFNSPEVLRPLRDSKSLLVFEEDAAHTLAPLEVSHHVAYQVMTIGCKVVLRAVAGDQFIYGDAKGDSVAIEGTKRVTIVPTQSGFALDTECEIWTEDADESDPLVGDVNQSVTVTPVDVSVGVSMQDVRESLAEFEHIKEVDEYLSEVKTENPGFAVGESWVEVTALAEEARERIRAVKAGS